MNQVLGSAVKRLADHQHVTWPAEREQAGGDRRHSALERRAELGAVPQTEPVLEYLQVRIVEPAVDEPKLLLGPLLAHAVGDLEERLAGLGVLEYEGGCLEDGTLDGPFGERRVVPVAHHHALRLQLLVPDHHRLGLLLYLAADAFLVVLGHHAPPAKSCIEESPGGPVWSSVPHC
jgi:hypothetical protein